MTATVDTVEGLIQHRLATALGGWRGSLETALPVLGFVGMWTLRHDVRAAVVTAGALALAVAVVRLLQRSTLQHVLTAVAGTALAAWFALRSGRAEDAFLPGILFNLGAALVVTVANVLRWPVVGFLVGVADPRASEDPFGWRRSQAFVSVCQRLTWVLVATYAVRLLVMMPLWLRADVALLGIAKIVLGWPLWILALALMGALLARGRTPLDVEAAALAEPAAAVSADLEAAVSADSEAAELADPEVSGDREGSALRD